MLKKLNLALQWVGHLITLEVKLCNIATFFIYQNYDLRFFLNSYYFELFLFFQLLLFINFRLKLLTE